MARNVEKAISQLEADIRVLERRLRDAQGRLAQADSDYEEQFHAADVKKLERKIADTQANLWELEDQL